MVVHQLDDDSKPLHPLKLTWNLKMVVSKRNLLFQGSIFRFHVSFRGSKYGKIGVSPILSVKKNDFFGVSRQTVYFLQLFNPLVNDHIAIAGMTSPFFIGNTSYSIRVHFPATALLDDRFVYIELPNHRLQTTNPKERD